MRWNYFLSYCGLCIVGGVLRGAVAAFDTGKWEAGIGAFFVMLMLGGPLAIVFDVIAWQRQVAQGRNQKAVPTP